MLQSMGCKESHTTETPGNGTPLQYSCLDSPMDGGSAGGALVKNPPANAEEAGDKGLILGLGKSPGGENGNSLQDSCLGNPMDRVPGGL